jgi:murein DD-endopeptidase MepM/ murein hydrolase activator NlpD
MFDKEKFMQNLKENKAVYITAISILLAMIVIVASVVATNRNKQTTPNVTTQRPTTTTTVKPSLPDDDPTSNVGSKLPTFSLPVSGKLLNVHDSELQVFSPTMNDYRVHLGIDVVTEENAPVYAAADGKITKIWEDVKMGYCMAIEHTGDSVTVYKNLGDTLPEGIAEGVSVRSGQLVATVGNSAMIEIAEEPHLHFEMTVGGLSVDPLEYYDETSLEVLGIDSSFGE